jgi:hypothetical protein
LVNSGNIVKEAEDRMKRIATPVRIGIALGIVAVVVGVNQVSSEKPNPRVLGTKVSNCKAGGVIVPLGVKKLRSDTLSVSIVKGRPASVLVPALKLGPGQTQPAAPVRISLGVRGTKPGTMNATVTIENATSCPVTFSAVQVSARRTASAVDSVLVSFGGRDRVVLEPGRRASGRASLPARTDGTWTVDATATADVGAA